MAKFRSPSATLIPDKSLSPEARLRRFYDAAVASLKRISGQDVYHHGDKEKVLKEEAERLGTNWDTVKKAWRIAETFTPKTIDSYCTLIKNHNEAEKLKSEDEREETSFGPTHLNRLLTVGDPAKREALAREAITSGWSVADLENAILSRQGRQKRGGNAPAVPDDPDERLADLEGLCIRWRRWAKDALGKGIRPKHIEGLLGKATTAVALLEDAINAWPKSRARRRSTRKRVRGSGSS